MAFQLMEVATAMTQSSLLRAAAGAGFAVGLRAGHQRRVAHSRAALSAIEENASALGRVSAHVICHNHLEWQLPP